MAEPARGSEVDVYDIHVEGTHCFFANGVLVHNCVIIDDPIKSRLQADSPSNRESIWKWFQSDLRTRLKPGAAIVLVMTRWHTDDLGGRILEMLPGRFRTLILPAFANEDDPMGRAPGEPLWKDDGYGYGEQLQEAHDEYERTGAMREWYALYQQSPRAVEGSLFKAAQIGSIPTAPALMGAIVSRGWDLAATRKMGSRDPDYTVGVKIARLGDGRVIVLDVIRFRSGPEEVERAILNTAAVDGHGVKIGLPQDPGQAGKAQVANLVRKLQGYNVTAEVQTGSKETRAAPFASQVNVGNVWMVEAPWNRQYVDELGIFPGSAHDDQIDASATAYGLVALPIYDSTMSWVMEMPGLTA